MVLKRDNANLKNQVKCFEIEVEQKENKIKQLMIGTMGAPDERLEERELHIAEVEERCEHLEKQLFKTKQELQQYGPDSSRFPKKNKDEQEKII